MIKHEDLITALRRMAPETGSLHCLGCGYERNCSLHGCAIFREAADRLTELSAAPPNPPLTLEQLREMDDPVWCRVDNCEWIPDGGFYCLCNKGRITTPGLAQYDCENLNMNLWRFYRRRPEA